MKKLYNLKIQGDEYLWSFEIEANPEHVEDWRRDGLEVAEIVNTCPEWAVKYNLHKAWFFLQDVLNFKNPFK